MGEQKNFTDSWKCTNSERARIHIKVFDEDDDKLLHQANRRSFKYYPFDNQKASACIASSHTLDAMKAYGTVLVARAELSAKQDDRAMAELPAQQDDGVIGSIWLVPTWFALHPHVKMFDAVWWSQQEWAAGCSQDNNCGVVSNLGVDYDCKGLKIAKFLLKALILKAKAERFGKLFLGVEVEKLKRSLYEKEGFTEVASPEGMTLMTMDLE